jgi:hypothetical protein
MPYLTNSLFPIENSITINESLINSASIENFLLVFIAMKLINTKTIFIKNKFCRNQNPARNCSVYVKVNNDFKMFFVVFKSKVYLFI